MKTIIILITLGIFFLEVLNAQNKNQVWINKDFNYTITLNFEKDLFKIDTVNYYEGLIYYFKSTYDTTRHKSTIDSSYFRINNIDGFVRFDCCEEDSIYKAIKRTLNNGIVDRSGKVNKNNLYWRVIKNKDVEIIYNNCPEEKLIYYNKIMDSIYK